MLPTLNELLEKETLADAILLLKENFMVQPFPPHRPYEASKDLDSSEKILKFAERMKTYEEALANFNVLQNKFYQQKDRYDVLITEYIKTKAGLYDLPTRSQEPVYRRVLDDVNKYDGGYQDIFRDLSVLVGLMKLGCENPNRPRIGDPSIKALCQEILADRPADVEEADDLIKQAELGRKLATRVLNLT